MAIVARLEDERRKVIALADANGGTCDAAGDFDALLPFDDPSFRCLGIIDPCGDTVFDRHQIPDLLDDIARLDLAGATDQERQGLRRLEAMARRCMDETNLYLRFVGD